MVYTCSHCQIEFTHNKCGRRPKLCDACKVLRNKIFYAENREEQKARAKAGRNKERDWLASKAWRAANRERHADLQRAWREANVEHRRAYRKEKYAANKDAELAQSRAYKLANKAELKRKAQQYLREHPEYNRYARSLRRAAEKRAMPPWADRKAIKEFYDRAVQISIETGVAHHVDHIFPLQSDAICGLHIALNLQIITAAENQSKSNRHWPKPPPLAPP